MMDQNGSYVTLHRIWYTRILEMETYPQLTKRHVDETSVPCETIYGKPYKRIEIKDKKKNINDNGLALGFFFSSFLASAQRENNKAKKKRKRKEYASTNRNLKENSSTTTKEKQNEPNVVQFFRKNKEPTWNSIRRMYILRWTKPIIKSIDCYESEFLNVFCFSFFFFDSSCIFRRRLKWSENFESDVCIFVKKSLKLQVWAVNEFPCKIPKKEYTTDYRRTAKRRNDIEWPYNGMRTTLFTSIQLKIGDDLSLACNQRLDFVIIEWYFETGN